ncbi:MAG: rod shape-determining protein MreC [bacterium]|nr:rod shape-determining protein MreC [bacterium]
MMMKYRPNISNKKKGRNPLVIFLGALSALFLTLVLINNFSSVFLDSYIFSIIKPVVNLKNDVFSSIQNSLLILREKKDLELETISLREKISAFEADRESFKTVLKENEEFKNIFGRKENKELLLVYVLARPGYGLYNGLIIDAGKKQGVEAGMAVTAYGDFLLGYVEETSGDSSKVKLISFPEKELNVFIEGKVAALAKGLGGETMQIVLPRDIEISLGDRILINSLPSFFVGAVEKTIIEPADPFQKIIFHLPVNIQELQRVYLIKNKN